MADITGRKKVLARKRRHRRVRKHISGTALRPRMNIFRSNRNIFVQVIDDVAGRTLVSCSTIDRELAPKLVDKSKVEAARLGIGVGKARAVPDSIRKAAERARRNIEKVSLSGTTIPYTVTGRHGGARVLLKPAAPGTGVIAGGGVRAVLEAVGVRNILTKSQGSANLLNVTLATLNALKQLRSAEELAQMRGKQIHEVAPVWERRNGRDGNHA